MASIPWPLIGSLVLVVAVTFHFRAEVASQLLKAFPGEPKDLRGLVWANSLQQLGGGGTQGTCCYPADWRRLEKLFCGSGLGVASDAIPMLGHCTEYVRGRAEWPIEMYKRGGYRGSIVQRGNIFSVQEAGPEASDSTPAAGKADEASCAVIKKCAEAKSKDQKCNEVRRELDVCQKR
mmetsp:Transcript_33933/g.54001  ORF Transcript_33933/g.54001 Transcript_33933/m.54001 type:complete len:178 (+) Transcript_33933:53-586(+)